MIEYEELTRAKIISITGAIATDYEGSRSIVPAFSRGYSNTVTNSGSGDYDGGDRVIGFLGCYDVHDDLIITSGWGDGAAIRRLNNDGSMTRLWWENNALYRDSSSVYNHINSMAIHRGSSQIALATHNVNGYSMIDYSDITDTTTTTNNVINNRPSSQFIFSNGANIDRAGSYYESGLVTAGDWLYILDYNATHYKKYPRRHWTNGTEQLLDGTTDKYSGSATIDRNGYRGQLLYDEVNDRVYYNIYYNANFTVILDASTASPKVLWCDLGDAGYGDDGWETGLYVPDPVNAPNVCWIGGSSRLVKVDYTNCFTGSAPTVSQQIMVEDASTVPNAYAILFRMGNKWQSTTGTYRDKLVANHIPISADRGKAQLGGWLDTENNIAVAPYRRSNITEDTTTGGRGRSVRHDYGHPPFRATSANGTNYIIQVGYGQDGHRFLVWPDSVGAGLIGNWNIEYGTFTATTNIDFVSLATNNHYVPSGCSITYYVSNDNGTTWEAYNPGSDSMHTFSSSGTQLRVKYTATGSAAKSAYKLSSQYDAVVYGSLYTSVKNPSIPMKVARTRLRGKK